MFNEPASSFDDDLLLARKAQPQLSESPQDDPRYETIRTAIADIFEIEQEVFALDKNIAPNHLQVVAISPDTRWLMSFQGHLKIESETAYAQLDNAFAPYGLLPLFREEIQTPSNKKVHIIHVLQGRANPPSGGNALSIILFVLTVLSVLYVGTLMAINEIATTNVLLATNIYNNMLMNLWRGAPYAGGLLLILGAHELGHYFASRFHKTAASLPYFLPFPFGIFGTFGAAIRLREPMRNRKVLLDIGAAGPLVGLAFAIPIVLIGLSTSTVDQLSSGYVEGNSLMYALAKIIVFGRFLPDGQVDVYVNQLAWAGWTGLLITGLNLIPVGQLDGGHVLYSLFGKKGGIVYYPVVGGLLILSLTIAQELMVFAILVLFIGNLHAVPLDDITPLDKRRQWVAGGTLAIFIFVFVPTPLTAVFVSEGSIPADTRGLMMLPVLMGMMWIHRHKWIWRLKHILGRHTLC
ncbi:MAG: site-2 protease family protein [Anaerolineae bacterium]|nr:site-2 protease family protein [Anaerolineae bacterium]